MTTYLPPAAGEPPIRTRQSLPSLQQIATIVAVVLTMCLGIIVYRAVRDADVRSSPRSYVVAPATPAAPVQGARP